MRLLFVGPTLPPVGCEENLTPTGSIVFHLYKWVCPGGRTQKKQGHK